MSSLGFQRHGMSDHNGIDTITRLAACENGSYLVTRIHPYLAGSTYVLARSNRPNVVGKDIIAPVVPKSKLHLRYGVGCILSTDVCDLPDGV